MNTLTVDLIESRMMQEAISFAKWINFEGYVEYDETDRWISPHISWKVYNTKELYLLFKSTQK